MLQSALRRLPPQLDADLRQFLCELLIPPPLPLPSTSSVSQLHTEKVATEDADKLVDILQELFSQHNVHCERLMSTAANATTDGGTSLCNLANSMGLPVEVYFNT
jgi:glycine cleavage system regulatory protein